MEKIFLIWKRFLLIFLPCFCFFFLNFESYSFFQSQAGSFVLVGFWILFWWSFEVVPIPVTSLLPLFLFPLLNIATENEVVLSYSHPVIFLFMGGFFLAKALQITNLHKRVALKVLSLIGGSYHGILLAFMMTSFFLSMWISNTATVLLMLSVASGVLLFFEERDHNPSSFKAFSAALCLGIAYSSSIGGTATLIGTPPNGLLSSYLKKQYDIELSMFEWIKDIFPFSILLFGILWVWFVYVVFRFPKQKIEVKDYLKKEESKLGVYSYDEKVVNIVLVLTAFAWIFRPLIEERLSIFLSDSMIAILGSLILFSWPSKRKNGFILDWTTASSIPWGILLMFGAGLSLANAFESTGLLKMVADYLINTPQFSPFFVLFLFSASALFLTEFLTNSAAMAAFLPLLSVFAERYNIPVTYLAIPCTLCCSFAFMLPIGTPPNAIVFSSGRVRLSQMIFAGFGLNLLALLAILLYFGF